MIDSKVPIESFDECLAVHFPLIRKLAYKATRIMSGAGKIPYEDGLALVQHAAWLAWDEQKKRSVEGRSPHAFGTYLGTFVQSVYKNDYKKDMIKWANGPRIEHLPEEYGENWEIEAIINAEQVNFFLGKLKPIEQEILRHQFFNDLTLEEIGEIVDLSRGRVHQIQQQALSTLGRLITEAENGHSKRDGDL